MGILAGMNKRIPTRSTPKRGEYLKSGARQSQHQATQTPGIAEEPSVDEIQEKKIRNILRDFSKHLAYFWGIPKK